MAGRYDIAVSTAIRTTLLTKEKAGLRNVQVELLLTRFPVPHDVIATCPVCAGELAVTRLRCGTCGTTIEGEFGVGRFARLTREQMQVLESFLRSRGNLRDMERELLISYPTVRARVEALVRALGFGPRDEADAPAAPAPATTDEVAAARREILERLANHELSAEEAAEAIRALGRTVR
jgi:hypothetical protein